MTNYKWIYTLLVTVGLLTTGARAVADDTSREVVVVMSAESGVESMTREQVEALFLGRAHRLPNGERAVPVDQGEGSPVRDRFAREILGRSSAQIRSHWSRIVFTGRGRPPRTVEDSKAVLRAVTEDPRVIGYMERKFVDDSVTVVLEE